MFGSAVNEVTEAKNSLLALQELPSHQDRAENQVHTTKKPSSCSKIVKFRVKTEMTQGSDHKGNTTKKRRGTAPTTGKTNQYERRVKELKTEEDERAQRRHFYWKRGSSKNSGKILRC